MGGVRMIFLQHRDSGPFVQSSLCGKLGQEKTPFERKGEACQKLWRGRKLLSHNLGVGGPSSPLPNSAMVGSLGNLEGF